jgi:hypothetical protein
MISNEKTLDMMSKGIVYIEYEKMDGTLRKAHATLQPAMIPARHAPSDEAVDSVNVKKYTRYYDLDVGDWRAFINDNLKSVEWSGKTFVVARPELLDREATEWEVPDDIVLVEGPAF